MIFGSLPCSMSFAPSSTMTASVPAGTDQSSRASPPEVVSPDTPALAISTDSPRARSAFSSFAGKASDADKPIAGGERIAECHDLHRPLRRRSRGCRGDQQKKRKCPHNEPASGPTRQNSHMTGTQCPALPGCWHRKATVRRHAGILISRQARRWSGAGRSHRAHRGESVARTGRGAGPYPQEHRPAYRCRRGDWPGRALRLRQIDPADGHGRAGASRCRRRSSSRARTSERSTKMRWRASADATSASSSSPSISSRR